MQNRIFYFGGYQGTDRETDPSTLQAFVPTAEMLRGDFTAVDIAGLQRRPAG